VRGLRIHKTACVVLAAGLSSRYGKPKQLALIGDKSLIQNAVDIANGSKSDYVYVVLGSNSSQIMESLKIGRAQVIFNKNYRQGLSASLRASIRNLPLDCTEVVLMAADQPFLLSKYIDRLINAALKKQVSVASLAFKGEPRSPALFSRRLFSTLLKVKGDKGAQEVVRKQRTRAALIDVDDPLMFLDIDTVENLEEALKSKKKMEKKSKQ
jgi:molybdenum cofactor cytidylyltransferase